MERNEDNHGIECRSYTHARRHPWVIGSIGGWNLPSPLTPTQILVMLGSFFGLWNTRSIWGGFGALDIFVLLGVPFGLMWALRYMRIEGRSPVRTVIGYATYALTPPKGIINGKPVTEGRANRVRNSRLFVMEIPDELNNATDNADAVSKDHISGLAPVGRYATKRVA